METKRKTSKKRIAIMNALTAVTSHPTAEMLYASLKPLYPELSLGTVSRNLAVLAEEGLVVSVAHVDGQERYDANTSPHAHFVCRCCRRVIDLALPDMAEGLYGEIERRSGCQAESCSLIVGGLCGECRAQ